MGVYSFLVSSPNGWDGRFQFPSETRNGWDGRFLVNDSTLLFLQGFECMMACRKSSAYQEDIEDELDKKPDVREEWAKAAAKKREAGEKSLVKFQYPDLDCYSSFFAEHAESSKTVTIRYHTKIKTR